MKRGQAMNPSPHKKAGGDEGDRTPDLGIANAALSQLSYIPDSYELNRNEPAVPG